MAWAAKLPCDPGVVWRDDGMVCNPLLADENAGTRGKGAKARGLRRPRPRNWQAGCAACRASMP